MTTMLDPETAGQRIDAWCETNGMQLADWQREMVTRILTHPGSMVWFHAPGRKWGLTTTFRVAEDLLKQAGQEA